MANTTRTPGRRRASARGAARRASGAAALTKIFDQSTPKQREFLEVWARAVGPQRPGRAGGPDAKAIALCQRLMDIEAALTLSYELIADEKKRDYATRPLDRSWWKTVEALFKLTPPRTREGVNAAARFMLSYVALEDYAEAAKSGDALMWASRVCAEYLAAEGGHNG